MSISSTTPLSPLTMTDALTRIVSFNGELYDIARGSYTDARAEMEKTVGVPVTFARRRLMLGGSLEVKVTESTWTLTADDVLFAKPEGTLSHPSSAVSSPRMSDDGVIRRDEGEGSSPGSPRWVQGASTSDDPSSGRDGVRRTETIAHLPPTFLPAIVRTASSFQSFGQDLSSLDLFPLFGNQDGVPDDEKMVYLYETNYDGISPQPSPPPTPFFHSPPAHHRNHFGDSSPRSPLRSLPSTPPTSRKSSLAATPDTVDAAIEATSRASEKLSKKTSVDFDPAVSKTEAVEVVEEDPVEEANNDRAGVKGGLREGFDDDERSLRKKASAFRLDSLNEEDEPDQAFDAFAGLTNVGGGFPGPSRTVRGRSPPSRPLRNLATRGPSHPRLSPLAPRQGVRPPSPPYHALLDTTRPLSLPPSSPPSASGAARPPKCARESTKTFHELLDVGAAQRNSVHPELEHDSRSASEEEVATPVEYSSYERIHDWRQVVASKEAPECDLEQVSVKLRSLSSRSDEGVVSEYEEKKVLQRAQTHADLRSRMIRTPFPRPLVDMNLADRRARAGTPPPAALLRASVPNLRLAATSTKNPSFPAPISTTPNRGPYPPIHRNARSE